MEKTYCHIYVRRNVNYRWRIYTENAVIADSMKDYGIRNPGIENGVTAWDKIKFESYYQEAEVQSAEPNKTPRNKLQGIIPLFD